jgi:hypothetical protein
MTIWGTFGFGSAAAIAGGKGRHDGDREQGLQGPANACHGTPPR